jgi:hypothetical protein
VTQKLIDSSGAQIVKSVALFSRFIFFGLFDKQRVGESGVSPVAASTFLRI